jgi:hypothetical protein
MKVMCNQCGKILDLMGSQSFAVEEEKHLKSFYFCSKYVTICPEKRHAVKQGLTSQK